MKRNSSEAGFDTFPRACLPTSTCCYISAVPHRDIEACQELFESNKDAAVSLHHLLFHAPC